MKLLFDQNLSHHLRETLKDLYPESLHVREVALKSSADAVIWDYARNNGFTVATKDSDFSELSLTHGHPPKVVWIRLGNCSTIEIETLLRDFSDDLMAFDLDEQGAVIALPYDETQPS